MPILVYEANLDFLIEARKVLGSSPEPPDIHTGPCWTTPGWATIWDRPHESLPTTLQEKQWSRKSKMTPHSLLQELLWGVSALLKDSSSSSRDQTTNLCVTGATSGPPELTSYVGPGSLAMMPEHHQLQKAA